MTLVSDLLMSAARNELTAPAFLADWDKLEQILKKFLWRPDLVEQWRRTWEGSMKGLKRPSWFDLLAGTGTDTGMVGRAALQQLGVGG